MNYKQELDRQNENEYRGILQLAYRDYLDFSISDSSILAKLIQAFKQLEEENASR